MNLSRYIVPENRIEAEKLSLAMADWVCSLAPWEVIAHLTFRWEASIWSAQRCYEGFMRSRVRGVSNFYALEENPGRDGFHVHAIWVDCLNLVRSDVWRDWFNQYGRGRIEPVGDRTDVCDYVAKYVTKERAWWGVNMISGRHPAVADFKLSND